MYRGCLRKTDPSTRPNQGESLAMNMEDNLTGLTQNASNQYFLLFLNLFDMKRSYFESSKMLFWQQSRCGTKKVWISIMVDQIPSILWPEISPKWSGETQPSLVWVLLDLTPGTIILNIFILTSWFSAKYLADFNYLHILWADRYTWKLRSYVMNSHVHIKCQNYSISITQSRTEITCNWSFFLTEIIFCWLGSGIIFFFQDAYCCSIFKCWKSIRSHSW